ncbi:MAG: diguanylate cyclase, partial [bacterium]|nr:diguanylate cyclase [bacterium]
KHLTLTVALDLLNADSKNLSFNGRDIILSDGKKIPVNEEGKTYLNWYGGMGSYEYIPVWKTDKAINSNDINFLKDSFENKIVYVGTTTTSLSDVKSTPLAQKYPGVEIHTTFLNNILDNNFIKKTGIITDSIITLILICLTGFIVIRSKSVPYAALTVFGINVLYAGLTLVLMYFFNLWVCLTLPVASSIGTITICYAIKYIVTSRDYEHTYKLAVTDGLTDMYNHRYFQEQMKLNIENAKRYNTPFSLIMVDIDFFKKFNDKYGHQSGDAVLRQVAQTIKKNIRSTDIPCRYGGEEMSVILTNTKKEDAALVAQKICEAVRNREFELATGDWTHVTISLGVATMPYDGEDVQQLIEYADKCLYIAKENGRNQVISSIS